MKSRLWTFLTLTLIVATIVSCGATAEPQVVKETVVVQVTGEPVRETVVVEVTSEMAAQPEPTQAPAEEPQPAGDEPMLNPDVSGSIELWHFWASPVRRNAIRRVIAICEEKLPNIDVTDTVKPFGDIWTANIAAVAAGSGMPDVIVSDRPTVPKDAADGIYMNLQEWADRDNVTREQFYDWAWDQAVYEGGTYGIPHETDVRVLFWNKQAFTEAGLDPEQPPETWDELETYADALDKIGADGTLERVGFFPLWNAGPDIWEYTNNADMIAEDGTPQINNPQMVELLEWIKGWVDRYGGFEALQAFRNQFGAPPNDVFMSGGVAMMVDIYGYNSALQFYRPTVTLADGSTPRMEWGISTLPYNQEPGNWSGGFSMSIPSGAANPEAAWEFIKCATGAEGQASWARDTQAQPTNLTAAQDPVLLADPLWTVVDESLSVSTGGIYVSGYPNWYEQVNQRLEQVWLGELTPQEALDQAQSAVEAEVGQ